MNDTLSKGKEIPVMSNQPLFAPYPMGDLDNPNRIVMAPLTRMRARSQDHVPTTLQAEYFAQRDSAGLIFGEAIGISPEGYGMFRHFRPIYKGTSISNVNMDRERGNRLIVDGLADLIAFGRPYIANPDLVQRFAEDAPLAEINWDTVYASGSYGYSDYPTCQPSQLTRS